MGIAISAVVLLFTLLGIFLLVYAAIVRYRGRHTREKYALPALGAITSIAIATITSVTAFPPWLAAVQIIGVLAGRTDAIPQGPHWSERILVLLFAAVVILVISRGFSDWVGQVSVRQAKQSSQHRRSNLAVEGLEELRRVLRRDSPVEIYKPPDYSKFGSALEPPKDSLTWRDHARELVQLKWPQYRFDIENGWHDRKSCWIGSDNKTGDVVGVMCCHNEPAAEEVKAFAEYVERVVQPSEGQMDLIVAVKEGENQKTLTVENREIIYTSQASLLEDLIDFTDYIADIRRRVETLKLSDSELTLNDIYVESSITDGDGNDIGRTLEKYVCQWLSEAGQRQIALLGEYGQGKSTGALMLTYHLLASQSVHPEYIPLLIELRGKSPATLGPLELLGAWSAQYRISPHSLMKLLLAGRLCLIFEGFDEMLGVADPEARLEHFRSLWKFCFPAAKILITGRPNFFLDDREMKAALGIDRPSGAGPYCEAIHLKPFDVPQIQRSLRWTNPEVREEIVSLAGRDAKFLDIVSRPSLLYIVGRLWETPELSALKGDVSSAYVMRTFIDYSFRRQTEKQRETAHFMVLTEDERRFFTDGIVAYMVAKDLKNQLIASQFDQAIERLYETIPAVVTASSALAEEPKRPLRDRLAERDDALVAVKTDVRTYGLLVRDYSRPDALRFPHKSFFEYLFAAYVVRQLLGQNPEACGSIEAATGVTTEAIVDLPESLAFVGELMAGGQAHEGTQGDTPSYLFDQIVVSGRLSLPACLRRLWLWAILAPYMQGFPRFLSPSAIMMSASFSASVLGLVFAFTGWGRAYIYLAMVPSFTVMAAMTLVSFLLPARRRVALWAYIAMNLEFTFSDFAGEFGRHIAEAMPRFIGKIFPHVATMNIDWDIDR